jgi:glycosyltransferase involved in cell wall biosynthesis
MSGYAEQLWRAYYPDIGHSVRITNGVDRKIFYPRQKDMRYLIYASAPNRGLDKLPLIVSAVREKVPVHMKAFSRLSALHPNEGNDEFDYASIQAEGLERCDPVPQEVLADELGKASAMILPTGYPEICSNVVLQSLASGTPVITTGGLGATPEWVRHGKNGMLTGFLPHDYMIHSLEMVRNTVSVLEDEKLHKRLIQGALQTRIPTWGEIGRKWLTLLHRYC